VWNWTWTSSCQDAPTVSTPVVPSAADVLAGLDDVLPSGLPVAAPSPLTALRRPRAGSARKAHRRDTARRAAPASRPRALPPPPARARPTGAWAAPVVVAPSLAAPAPRHRTAPARRHRPAPAPAPLPSPWPGPAVAAGAASPAGGGLVIFALAVMVAVSLLGPAAPGGRLVMTAVRRLRAGTSRLERPG
jgi:hypothetical protein